MISENEKVYYICQQCSKTSSCQYYKQVISTIKQFINTPLNIHFPMCKEYDSALCKLFRDIEQNDIDVIDINNIPKDDIKHWFNEYIKDYIKRLKENLDKI